MSRTVPWARPEPSLTRVYAGGPPSSTEWYQYGQLANFLLGKGAQHVPEYVPELTIGSGSTANLRFRTKTRGSALQRVWYGSVRAASAVSGVTIDVQAPAGTGTLATYPAPIAWRREWPFVYIEAPATSASEQEISISIKATGGTGVVLDRLGCFDVDRPQLEDAGSEFGSITGPHLEALLSRQMIKSDIGFGEIASVLRSGDARRVGIFQLATNDNAPWTKAGAGYVSLLTLGVPILGHKDLIADTTRKVSWSVYAKVSSGTGNVQIATSHSGVLDTVTVSSVAYAWTATRTISIDCEDLTTVDGLPGGVWDLLTAQFQGGVGTISLAALSIWNDGA